MTLGSWKGVPVKDVSPTQAIAGAPPSEAEAAVRSGRQGRRTSRLTPYLFLLVPLALLVVFTYSRSRTCSGTAHVQWDGLSPARSSSGRTTTSRSSPGRSCSGCFMSASTTSSASFVQIAIALYFATC